MRPYVAFPGILEPDPELYVRLKASASSDVRMVLGRQLVMTVDAFGCRPVVGQPPVGAKTLAIYGCSCTYGHAISAEETFCSLLQEMLPGWRVENYGVPGYGSTQNLLHLRRNSRWSTADYVTFCWIPHHLLRNVADLPWILKLMEGIEKQTLDREFRFPRACLSRDGGLEFRSVELPRWDLIGIDLTDFRPDWHYLELLCINLFKAAAEIVEHSGGHFFVTTLLGHLSDQLRRKVEDAGIPLVNAEVHGAQYQCIPDDHHPNARANRLYANRIYEYLFRHSGGMLVEGDAKRA